MKKLVPESLNEAQDFEQGQDPKRAMGIGDMGRTDMRKGIDSMTHFLYYAQPEFIDDIWGDNPMFANHMKEKMANGMDREDTDYMSPSVLMRFVRELDTGNMRMLYDYIIDNHTDKW